MLKEAAGASPVRFWPTVLASHPLVLLLTMDFSHPLLAPHLQLLHHADLGHGGILLDSAWQGQIVQSVRTMLEARR
jgi:hypothetical protein